jgi:hypothetical protein
VKPLIDHRSDMSSMMRRGASRPTILAGGEIPNNVVSDK